MANIDQSLKFATIVNTGKEDEYEKSSIFIAILDFFRFTYLDDFDVSRCPSGLKNIRETANFNGKNNEAFNMEAPDHIRSLNILLTSLDMSVDIYGCVMKYVNGKAVDRWIQSVPSHKLNDGAKYHIAIISYNGNHYELIISQTPTTGSLVSKLIKGRLRSSNRDIKDYGSGETDVIFKKKQVAPPQASHVGVPQPYINPNSQLAKFPPSMEIKKSWLDSIPHRVEPNYKPNYKPNYRQSVMPISMASAPVYQVPKPLVFAPKYSTVLLDDQIDQFNQFEQFELEQKQEIDLHNAMEKQLFITEITKLKSELFNVNNSIRSYHFIVDDVTIDSKEKDFAKQQIIELSKCVFQLENRIDLLNAQSPSD